MVRPYGKSLFCWKGKMLMNTMTIALILFAATYILLLALPNYRH